MLKIYLYNDTNEYDGESVTMLDPEETKIQGKDVWLMPPNSTTLKPELKEGYVPVWNGKLWEYVEDHRGEKGWVGGVSVVIEELGPLPADFTVEAPEPTLAEQAELRRQEILFELSRIDSASSRPLRAILAAQALGEEPNAADVAKLTGYEASAKRLRAELSELN